MATGPSSQMSTKEKLLLLVDDIEMISKDLIENFIGPKHLKYSEDEYSQIARILIAKDKELKDTMRIAGEQAEIQKKMDLIQTEIDKYDQEINTLQKQLKEAESILSTAIFQAKQKLHSIHKASERTVSSEELIKYAHRISASNAVAAPHNWQPGDPRRPYPTDIEMRLGYLGRLSDLPSGHLISQQSGVGATPGTAMGNAKQRYGGSDQTFTWQAPADIAAAAQRHQQQSQQTHSSSMDTKGHSKDNEDVEVMSTDSSGGSSSGGQ